jgi:hypothetical protein
MEKVPRPQFIVIAIPVLLALAFVVFTFTPFAQAAAKVDVIPEEARAIAKEESLKGIAYDAFIYAYPMMEQVKTVNGMVTFMNQQPNKAAMNPKFPMAQAMWITSCG